MNASYIFLLIFLGLLIFSFVMIKGFNLFFKVENKNIEKIVRSKKQNNIFINVKLAEMIMGLKNRNVTQYPFQYLNTEKSELKKLNLPFRNENNSGKYISAPYTGLSLIGLEEEGCPECKIGLNVITWNGLGENVIRNQKGKVFFGDEHLSRKYTFWEYLEINETATSGLDSQTIFAFEGLVEYYCQECEQYYGGWCGPIPRNWFNGFEKGDVI